MQTPGFLTLQPASAAGATAQRRASVLSRLTALARRLLGLGRADGDGRVVALPSGAVASIMATTPGAASLGEIERIANCLWRDAGQARSARTRACLRGDTRTMSTAEETLGRLAAMAATALADLHVVRNRGEIAHLLFEPSEALLRSVIACWEPHPVEVMDLAGVGPYRRADLRESCDRTSPLLDGTGDDAQPEPRVGRYPRAVSLR